MNRAPWGLAIVVATAMMVASSTLNAATADIGVNLIENGSFEAQGGHPGWSGADHVIVAWEDGLTYGDTTAGNLLTPAALITYVNDSTSEFVLNNSETLFFNHPDGLTNGPAPGLGENFLYSGERSLVSDPPGIAGSQTLALTGSSAVMSLIDSGSARYIMSGYFGGWDAQNDFTSLEVNFLGGMGEVLGTDSLGLTDHSQHGSVKNAFVFLESHGTVPIGTESLEFVLATTTGVGSHSGALDGLSFTIVPEPGCGVLAGVVFTAIAMCYRRQG